MKINFGYLETIFGYLEIKFPIFEKRFDGEQFKPEIHCQISENYFWRFEDSDILNYISNFWNSFVQISDIHFQFRTSGNMGVAEQWTCKYIMLFAILS